MDINEITGAIIEAACKVHTKFGPGLLENVYKICLKHELLKKQMNTLSEVAMPVFYDGQTIEMGYRLDLLVENTVIVELKAIANIAPIHKTQLLTYLRLSDKPVGLLLNFGVTSMRDGITRVAN